MAKLSPKKAAKIAIPILLGFFFVTYSITSASAAERLQIWHTIINADPFWVSISVGLGLLSHWLRALRWKYTLLPLGCKPRVLNSFFAIMFGYLSNLGIPRSGEILRGASLATYEDVSFQKSFGTIVSERIIDLVMLLIIIGVALLYQSKELLDLFTTYQINPFMSLFILVVLIGLFFLFLKILRISNHPLVIKIRNFFEGLWEGMQSILHMKYKFPFILYTIFIWGLYICVFMVVKYSIPELDDLGFGPLLVAFIVGTFSMSLTSGGIGIFPISIGVVLQIYGIEKVSGEAFGWILWSSQTAMTVVIGIVSAILLPVYNKNQIFE
jgi:uncharacterized membrane protein YbhN (UPF0104 family)